jgi:catechol 2,3-dioxygenase-like lactoylglutathione lyase family enzyme
MSSHHTLIAILASSDLEASTNFYARLGFSVHADYPPHYRLLSDGRGAELHLTAIENGSLDPARNAFGVYFYTDDVDGLAAEFGGSVLYPPQNKPWGMYEFGVCDPDGTLVRVGRPAAR